MIIEHSCGQRSNCLQWVGLVRDLDGWDRLERGIVQVCETETVQVGGTRGINNRDGANGVSLCPCSLYKESIVDVEGTVAAAPEKIASCSQEDVEIVISKVATCV